MPVTRRRLIREMTTSHRIYPNYSDREELHKANSTERFEEMAMQRCVADATWLPHAFEAGSRIAASAKNGDNTSDRWL